MAGIKINWIEVFLFLFSLILLGLSVVHFMQADELRSENAALSDELAGTNAELKSAKETVAFQGNTISGLKLEMEQKDSALESEIEGIAVDLNGTKGRVSEIEEDFDEFREEYVELQGQYEEKAAEYEALMGEIGDFELDLQEKMYWYTENADFGGETKGFLSRIDTKCIDDDVLNMPCVAYVLDERDYKYRSEGKDYIKSLEEFENDNGGDCEDWSIFVKAIINEISAEYEIDELRVVDFNRPGYFEVYTDDDITYYYSYADINMKIEDLQVACFPVRGGYGHCALVSEDVIFEPQDGSYLARAYWDEESYLIRNGGFVEVLMDDEDIHVDTGDGWISYASFIEEIELILEK
ncbi:MAG: hypothetical protein GY852_09575 [bacterium]|nr:hypothetical protein [bacterium]